MRAAWLACAAVLAGCGAAQARADRFVGQPLPLVVQDLATARPLDPARWRGQVVVVDLWASWCESCKAAMPHHVRLWQRLHARGLEVVAVSVDEDCNAAREFLQQMPLPFVVAWDAGQRTVAQLQPAEMPTTYVLDRQGIVRAEINGATAAALRTLDAAVEAALEATPAQQGDHDKPTP